MISSASSLAAASLITFGVLSTNSLASFKPRPVISRTTLITLIFCAPALVSSTSNSVFSAAASPAPPSTATGAVLPEVDDVDIEIHEKDLRIDVYRSSGNGGQCVNTTDSAVRITHLPTGTVVACQDEKSQLKNKEKAMKVLRARLYEVAEAERLAGIAEDRKSQVGTGDRSERIRTYNYPQGRVTDHRIGLTLYKLDSFLNGDIDEVINALITADQAEKMKAMGNTDSM